MKKTFRFPQQLKKLERKVKDVNHALLYKVKWD